MISIEAICVGQPKPFNGAELSAIDKMPLSGPVRVRHFGIEGDMVGDPRVHGGQHMAVHHYPTDHYRGWDAWLGGHDLLKAPAAFGENLMVYGLTEGEVSIGDRFRLGNALLEVSQPRVPCWKIEHRFGRSGMIARIVKQGMCGWYYRVIEEGEAQAGDSLQLIERFCEAWTVARTFSVVISEPKSTTLQEWEMLTALEPLAPEWREKAAAHV